VGIDSVVQTFQLVLEVFFLDLLLSGDNAVVIALACRSLPSRQKRQALLMGTGIAIGLRVLLTLVASLVLEVPLLKLLGGLALLVIAIQLTLDEAGGGEAGAARGRPPADLASVIGTVVLADLVMSTDNVLALAAVAHGRVGVLALGLVLSVPLLMFGSWQVTALLQRYPVLVRLGGALLGWLAGDIAVSDPLYARWVGEQSPALAVVVPALAALYVVLQGRIIEQARPGAEALRPVSARRAAEAEEPVPAAATPPPVRLPVEVPPAAPPRDRRPPPWRWVAAGGGLLAVGVLWLAWNTRWMPVPADLLRYDCPARDVSLRYRPGGQRIRMANATASISGVVGPDNQIDWGDLHVASTALGFVPPTRVTFGDARSVRIDGGMFEDMTCPLAATH
jgi:YjbE family integral membrane protein